jgi:hypothetical protein
MAFWSIARAVPPTVLLSSGPAQLTDDAMSPTVCARVLAQTPLPV